MVYFYTNSSQGTVYKAFRICFSLCLHYINKEFRVRVLLKYTELLGSMTPCKCCKFVHNPMRGFENMYSRTYATQYLIKFLMHYTKVVYFLYLQSLWFLTFLTICEPVMRPVSWLSLLLFFSHLLYFFFATSLFTFFVVL